VAAALSLASPALAHAQDAAMDHSGHQMAPEVSEPPSQAEAPSPHAGHDMAAQPGMQGMAHGDHGMGGALGAYSMGRDSSGSAWQPESAPMVGWHGQAGGWSTMVHGEIWGVWDDQGGPRGEDKAFSESMIMAMAQRPLGAGTLTLRAMGSLDPLMGRAGYPLLLQTGETADGHEPLIDRQHPHDAVMELAAVVSQPLGAGTSAFLYAGYPGEPALGPATFMHRASGMDNPEAPISHHWLDATHITFGVVTAGLVHGGWKIEASAFNGREPDQNRWDFDPARLDSWSARLTWNPAPDWSLQVSHGALSGPEQLEPGVDIRRTTASASYNRPLTGGNWATTLAWGRNAKEPGPTLDAILLESAFTTGRHTIFGRGEVAEKDELFGHHDPLHGRAFTVGKLSVGYIYDAPVARHLSVGVGAMGSVHALPGAIRPFYGDNPASYMVFTRLRIR
jgi:hypothetical protein